MRSYLSLVLISLREIIRQPFYLLALGAGSFLIIASPAFTLFTFYNAQILVMDMGLSTILVVQLLLGILSSVLIVGREMEEKTTMILLSKPISRLTFLLAKFTALTLSLFLILIPLISLLIMTLRLGVPEAAYSPVEYSVLWMEFLPFIIAGVIAGLANYYADKNFSSLFTVSLAILFPLFLFLLSLLDEEFKFNPFKVKMHFELIKPALFLWWGASLFSSLTLVFSLSGRIVLSLTLSLIILLLGLSSESLWGRLAEKEVWARILHITLPNLQLFWVQDYWEKDKTIPLTYIFHLLRYTIFYSLGIILIGWGFWERREVGVGRKG